MPYCMGAPFLGSLVALAGELADLAWRLPRIADFGGGWQCANLVTDTAVMGGDPTKTYDVTMRIVGVVELHEYSGGSNDGAYFQTGGSGISGTWNQYSISTDDPAATYFVNRNPAGPGGGPALPVAVDFEITIPIQGGATVTATGFSGGDVLEASHTISVPGVTDPTQPYVGQWLNITVLSVVEA